MDKAQLDMDEALWAAGYERMCVDHPDVYCRFEPCTISHGIRCCAECEGCANPCPMAKHKTRRQ